MKNVLEYLEYQAKIRPDKVAVIDEKRTFTYGKLETLSQICGSYLAKYELTKQPIVVLMEKSSLTLISFLGIVYSGNFYVLFNPDLPVSRLKQMKQILKSQVVITDKQHLKMAEEIFGLQEIVLIEEILTQSGDYKKLKSIRQKMIDIDPLYTIFTSGSTGVPKGVVVSHRSVISFINDFVRTFEFGHRDILANQAPFDFDVSVKDIYTSLKVGATLVIVDKKMFLQPVVLIDYLCQHQVTVLIWAVSALCLITSFHGLDYKVPRSLKKVLFSGEVMPLSHLKQWMSSLPQVEFVNLYGPTEVTCNCSYHIIDCYHDYQQGIPIDHPFSNRRVFLLDEHDQESDFGEIVVSGNLALGYYNDLQQTNTKFVQNPLNDKYPDIIYRTGDLGRIDQNDSLYFCGRKDFQIKHQGHRIELEEIELAVNGVNGVIRSCVVYDDKKSRIYCFYQGDCLKEAIYRDLKQKLPIYMIPSKIKQVDNFILNKNGKIDRKLLLKRSVVHE